MHFISGLNKVSLLTSLYFAAQETRLAFILDLLFFLKCGGPSYKDTFLC